MNSVIRLQLQEFQKAIARATDNSHDGKQKRKALQEFYQSCHDDATVFSSIEKIKNSIHNRKIKLEPDTGSKIKNTSALTKKLNTKWFDDFIDAVIETYFYGYTLLEILIDEQGIVTDLVPIRRQFVVPEEQMVYMGNEKTINLLDKDTERTTILLRDDYLDNLGNFVHLCKLQIYKKNTLSYNQEYIARVGIPPIVLKGDITDEESRTRAFDLMKRWGNGGALILPSEIEVLFPQPHGYNQMGTEQLFSKNIAYLDRQLRAAILGSEDTGAERQHVGAVEAGERALQDFLAAHARRISHSCKEQLFKKLIAINPTYWKGIDKCDLVLEDPKPDVPADAADANQRRRRSKEDMQSAMHSVFNDMREGLKN